MKDKIRVGIIGTGFARLTQIPAFLHLEDAEMVSVASANPANAEKAAREFNIPHFTGDWRETASRDDIDLISIATPPVWHKEMTLFALEQGKHVLCEKPMAMNAAEASEMTEKAVETGVMALIDHELRFVNGRRRVFEMLRGGEIGKIIHAKYHFNNASRGDTSLPWTWWADARQGGGTLGAIGSHVIDSFRWFLDTEISEVFCRLQTHVKQRPDKESGGQRTVTSDDETLMILHFKENDLTEDATAIASLSMVEAGHYRNAIEFFGTNGAVRIEDGGEIFLAGIKENKWKQIEVELGEIAPRMRLSGWSRGFMNIAREIIGALKEGRTRIEHGADFAEGLKIQKVLDAARESSGSGCVITPGN